jgi:drug/metabolite transporter (DMT)-like permease
MSDHKIKGSVYALLSALMYAASSTIGKKIQLAGFSTTDLLMWRYAIALLLGIIIIYLRRSSLDFDKKALGKTFLSAVLFYSGSTFCYFYSFNHIGTGLASAICSINTVIVTLYVWIWDKEKIKITYIFSIILTIFGFACILKARQDTHIESLGILFALLSGLLYAFYVIFNRDKATKLDPILSSAMLFLASFVIYLISSLSISGSVKVPQDSNVWLLMFAMGLVFTLLPIYFLLKALSYLNASDVTLMGILRPVFATLLGLVFLGESLSMLQAAGIIFIITGTIVNQLKIKARAK